MATGVLIIGIGKGTKKLQTFLECTKVYEATLLFGVATDTYDVLGKVLSHAPYDHITRVKVEEALPRYRGLIMQRPPLFSALRIQGKRLYEYAREGKEVPVEIRERPIMVENIEITKWLNAGCHDYHWPIEEAEEEEKAVADGILHLGGGHDKANMIDHPTTLTTSLKRKRSTELEEKAGLVAETPHPFKRQQVDAGNPTFDDVASSLAGPRELHEDVHDQENPLVGSPERKISRQIFGHDPKRTANPPAVKLRMTVGSGFYVRSLCHDLGKAVGSLGIMSDLIRTRQGQFELGRNVLDYDDLGKGEAIWGPKIEEMLNEWQDPC